MWGHCCTSPGMSKVTIGNGCFLLTNVGVRPIMSNSGFISTVAFKLAGDSTFFGLEESVVCAGQALDRLNVGLGMAREEVVDLVVDLVVIVLQGLCWGQGCTLDPGNIVRATIEGWGKCSGGLASMTISARWCLPCWTLSW